ncbi:MAG: caspase family protein [Planctomycetaceae bacterium]|nr:caspase family protein [Planctomycetaceae bacterium]
MNRSMLLRGTLLLYAVLAANMFMFQDAVPAAPAQGDSSTGSQWAILIGVENYQFASPLAYTVNDVDQLAKTLQERGGVPARNVVRFVDTADDETRKPLQQTLMKELPIWLQKPGPDDRLIVYFSGHGFRSEDGRLYLAPLDCDPQNPAETGLSVAWLRDQLAGCRASLKLLVLDACHAGTEKGDQPDAPATTKSLTANDLGEPFRDLEGVVTLASSTSDQKSQIWAEKRQSLFTYWLNQGLKGHADDNGDGTLDIDELNKYVHHNVSQTAETRFHRAQTPVRIIRSGVSGVPKVLELNPLQLRHLIADMADQIAWSMEARGLKKLGVMQFTTDTQFGETLGGEFGALGRWCAAELENKLIEAGTFEIVDSRELVSQLKANQFTVDQLGSRDALARLSASLDGLPAIVTGTLRHRQNRQITLQSKLKQLDINALAGAAGGSALLNENEWAMLGYSAALKAEDRPRPSAVEPPQTQLIAKLDEQAQEAHPLSDPSFPYRVSIYVNGQERPGVFRGNDYIVPLRKNEVYAIRIQLLGQGATYMRLLVDGLNTLPEKSMEKGIDTFEVAPIVNLDEARGWILDPATSQSVWEVRGFVTEVGAAGKLRRFVVVDDNLSLAARKNFTENLGLITAAFYSPVNSRSGTGVEAVETSENFQQRRGVAPGDLLSVIHIRYTDPSEIPDGQ